MHKAQRLAEEIRKRTTRKWAIMEVCGGQTHSILRNGIDQLLPVEIELIHGPGCPVCVTPLDMIDKALAIAARPEVIFCSFGDMLRVPGSTRDLFGVKSCRWRRTRGLFATGRLCESLKRNRTAKLSSSPSVLKRRRPRMQWP